jgi:hypothetical protein
MKPSGVLFWTVIFVPVPATFTLPPGFAAS